MCDNEYVLYIFTLIDTLESKSTHSPMHVYLLISLGGGDWRYTTRYIILPVRLLLFVVVAVASLASSTLLFPLFSPYTNGGK